MRMYVVRFWRRMLTLGKTVQDIDTLLAAGTITQEEYDAIIAP